jgi:hypothetical protein
LAARLAAALADVYPGSAHVGDIGLLGAADLWVRLGSCATQDIIRLLRDRRDDIEAFLQHEEAGFLALA